MPPPITWYYDPRTRRYHDNVTHRFLAFATVEGLMEKSLDALHKEADVLSALIADKAIPIGEWEAGMQTIVRRAYEANCTLARGGLAQVTDADREKVSEFLEFQFERLNRFAGQIVEEHWTARGGAIRRRARMYVNSGRQIFWYVETQNQKEIGGKWERWVLLGGVGDEGTCADCIALSAKGWVEIGTLPQPTDGSTQCLSSCRCKKRYSKAKKRPRVRGALRAFLKTAVVLKLMGRLGFSAKEQERGSEKSGYYAPHKGRPGQVGGSLPRDAPEAEVADYTEDEAFSTAAKMGKVVGNAPLGDGYCRAEILEYADDGSGVWKKLRVYEGHDGNSEVAAYRISELLGLDIVPETVFAIHDGLDGTSQGFIPDVDVGWDYLKRLRQKWAVGNQAILENLQEKMWLQHGDRIKQTIVLDYIIGNNDRHHGNWMVDATGHFWAVDHGHSTWRKTRPNDVFDIVNMGLVRMLYRNEHSLSVPYDTIKKWKKITYAEWEETLIGVSEKGNVRLDAAWTNFQRLIDAEELEW